MIRAFASNDAFDVGVSRYTLILKSTCRSKRKLRTSEVFQTPAWELVPVRRFADPWRAVEPGSPYMVLPALEGI